MAKIIRPFDLSKPFKLEVGSGSFPQSGYIHVDCDEGMPELDILCRMGDEALPVPDRSVLEILSNHSIEHVSWLKVDAVVMDWYRVLLPGSKLFLRTPDLEFICKSYMEAKITREHPTDESNMVSRFGDVGPAEWANIKLFAGQNYPGNFHHLCFDFPMLQNLLERVGFCQVKRVRIFPVFSPGEIQCEAYKPDLDNQKAA